MKTRRMLLAACLALLCLLGLPATSGAQVYSQNIVGYINQPIYAGNNLIANQLGNTDNSLSAILSNNIPEGATFTKWNASQLQYLPLSTYDTATGWSINYDLTYGEGGLFNTPVTFTNTFVGSVWPSFNGQYPFNTPLISDTGVLLLSCLVPIGNATFYDVVGRDPAAGEYVMTLNPLTQAETVTMYDGSAWDNGSPALAVGQAAFFGLGGSAPLIPSAVAAVPEPSTYRLLGAGLLMLAAWRNLRQRN